MSSNNKKTGNLVALGSAAVVAVYGAGFMRTAAAAERFAQQSTERVLSPAEAEVIAALANNVSNGASVPNASQQDALAASKPANKVDATTAKVKSPQAGASGAVAESNANTRAPAPGETKSTAARDSVARASTVANQSTATTPNASSAPSVQPATTTVASNAQQSVTSPAITPTTTTSTTTPATATAAPVVPAPSTTSNVSSTVVAPTTAPASTAKVEEGSAPTTSAESKPALKWKDGNYTGYGTSRHGDIEVYLETDGGKISYLKISQCLTQYSCSWISELPGQVISRQSPKVDAPSGATQSATAFYYAVVQALAKAAK